MGKLEDGACSGASTSPMSVSLRRTWDGFMRLLTACADGEGDGGGRWRGGLDPHSVTGISGEEDSTVASLFGVAGDAFGVDGRTGLASNGLSL